MKFFEVFEPRHVLLITPTFEQTVKLYSDFFCLMNLSNLYYMKLMRNM